jgi:hypothetical protein
MSLSPRERCYIKARLSGASDGEACAAAGYTARPPARVLKLAAKVLALKAEPELLTSYRARREDLEARIEAIRAATLRPLYKERAKLASMEALAELLLGEG